MAPSRWVSLSCEGTLSWDWRSPALAHLQALRTSGGRGHECYGCLRCSAVAMIQNISVRLATLEDAAAIAALSREYIEHGLPWSWTEARVTLSNRDVNTNVA